MSAIDNEISRILESIPNAVDAERLASHLEMLEALAHEAVVEPEWEYGAIYQGDNGIELRWFSMGASAFTVREAAEKEVERFADAQIVLGRRTKPGIWSPVHTDGAC